MVFHVFDFIVAITMHGLKKSFDYMYGSCCLRPKLRLLTSLNGRLLHYIKIFFVFLLLLKCSWCLLPICNLKLI